MPPRKARTKSKEKNQTPKKQQKKVVQFSKIVNKKNITPLATYKKDALNFPEDCLRTDPKLSFMEVTDPTLSEIEVPEIVPAPKKKEPSTTARTPKKKILKKEAPSGGNTLWAEQFIPESSCQDLMLCPDVYRSFQGWLNGWKKYLAERARVAAEELSKKMKKNRRQSRRFKEEDSGDDFSLEAPDTNDMGSTYILAGPVGCGKTSLVYLFAKEIGFNVIEMSASDLRSSVVMNKKLQGAIETFDVRGPGDIRSMSGGVQKRRNSSTCEPSAAISNNLILIDDADVVFQKDVNFWPKLASFCNESKIPIVLTCSNLRMVKKNLPHVHVRTFNFPNKESSTVARCIKKWLKMKHPEASVDETIIKAAVVDAKQDVRKALNNLQFHGRTLPTMIKDDMPKLKLSSQDLAELDCVLTKCKEEEEKVPVKVQLNASIFADYDYVPAKDVMNSFEIPAVSNSNDLFIEDLSNLIASSRDPSYADFDKRIQRQSMAFQRHCGGRFAPMLPAIWDTIQRRKSFRPLKNIALYELPLLSSIHKGFRSRMQTRLRKLHPFDQVDNKFERALDQYGNLKNTIDEYNSWMDKKKVEKKEEEKK